MLNLLRPLKQDEMTGVLGLFNTPEQLKEAAKKLRDQNVKQYDAFTPFPIHGLEDCMNIPRSPLPWVTFLAGLTGLATAFGLQTWVATIQWKLNVGGKPFFSLPAFIPVMFELTVLFAGLATAFTMLGWCRVSPKNKILDPRITDDKFALFVSSTDKSYNEGAYMEFMKKYGAQEVKVVK